MYSKNRVLNKWTERKSQRRNVKPQKRKQKEILEFRTVSTKKFMGRLNSRLGVAKERTRMWIKKLINSQNWIQLSNKNKWLIHSFRWRNVSLSWRKEAKHKRVSHPLFHVYEIPEKGTPNLWWQKSCQSLSGAGDGRKALTTVDQKETGRVIKIIYVLIGVVVMQECTFVETPAVLHLRCDVLLHVTYIQQKEVKK